MKGFRPIVPRNFRRQVFHINHDLSHPGARGTLKLIAERFVWTGMRKDVKDWCRACLHCGQSKIQRHTVAPLMKFPPPSERFERVHLDLVGPLTDSNGFTYLLSVNDHL